MEPTTAEPISSAGDARPHAGLNTPHTGSIAASTTLGPVRLNVSDLGRTRTFYEGVLGLAAQQLDRDSFAFGPPQDGRPPLVEVRADASAPPLDRRATGLYHVAILLPSRVDLAHALLRVARSRWPLDGASDHLVSEALYLSDPDGNGIEIYRDRPRDQWRYDGATLQMSTLPLDLRAILAEAGAGGDLDPAAEPAVDDAVPAGTVIGHVHLQVADLREAEAFYNGVLGFDVVVRGYPGALFVSAGGYHHHLGLNTWHSAGSGPARPGSIGLRSYDVILPDATELERVVGRVQAAGLPLIEGSGDPGDEVPQGRLGVRDPSGNLVVLRSS
ncbi:MAG: VOC family protein [Solirubrobacteraceae bacterium]